MPSEKFERKRALQSLRRDLDAHSDDTILLVVLRAALDFGAFASWLPSDIRSRLTSEAFNYDDFYLHKALIDDGAIHAPRLSARERLDLKRWVEGDDNNYEQTDA